MAMKTVKVQGKAAKNSFSVPEEWEEIRHLGSGAYAVVAAFKSPDGTDFAVKKVERVFDHPVLALRTLREVRLLAHFRHPNVLGLRKLFVEGPTFQDVYMCLDMMDGDLNQLIHATKEPLTDHQVQCVLYQLARGLLCLRKAHVIHRDLKPGNILVKAGGSVKIADLGLARTIDADDDNAGQSENMAVLTEYVVTRFYRAPEIVLTATHYTYAVDIWSSGCILGEMLTKQPLFEGKDSLDQIRKIVKVIGTPTPEDMAWIPRSSPSWKFVEMCRKSTNGEAFQKILQSQGANPLATELLSSMLRFDPSRRISVEQTMIHRYLAAFDACQDPEVAAARAVPPVDWSFDRSLCFDDEGQPKPFDEQLFRQAFLATRLAADGPPPTLKDRALANGGRDLTPAVSPAAEAQPTAAPAGDGYGSSPERRKSGRWGAGSGGAGSGGGYSGSRDAAPPPLAQAFSAPMAAMDGPAPR